VSVTVYTTNASGTDETLNVPLGRPVDLGGVNVCYFRSTFGPKSMFYSRDLLNKMRATVREFDAVYISGWFTLTGVEAARICRKNQVPVIAGTYGGFMLRARRKSYVKKKLFRELFIRRALNGVTAVILSSKAEQNSSTDWLDGRPVIIVPNAVDPGRFYPCPNRRDEFRQRYNIPLDVPVLISVTRFDWMKRVDLLIGALAKSDRWHLVLVGDWQSGTGPSLKRYAQTTGVSSRIVWTGYVDNEGLCAALSATDLFALVSETENFGNVVAEAMMCGLPVLVSKQAGVWEYISDQPFVIAPELSIESIVDSLRNFEQNGMNSRIDSAYIRQAAIDKFSPQTVARNFIYELQRYVRMPKKGS
jgi:glycosyltransferase involved in cell wall biosynthesis